MALTEPAVALKLALEEPAATVTPAETVNTVLLSEIATAAPPAGAAEDSVTVQLVDPPDTTVEGEHCKFETVGRTGVLTVIVPPVPAIALDVPSGSTPATLLSGREREEPVPVVDSVTFRTATAPDPMVFAFMPEARHMMLPAFGLQETVLPAAVRAGPADVVTDDISLAG